MKAPLSNFIPLNRKLFKHAFWVEKRAYSRFEAWLDLIVEARFDNSEARKLIGGVIVQWGRGELVASIRFLMERWGWTKNKVESFLKLLKSEGMIKTRTADRTAQTVITICNYDAYNSIKEISGQQTGQEPDSNRTAAGQEPDKTNKENKEQKSKEREIYRHFAHLILFTDEYFKLIDLGYTKAQIDHMLNEIENYKYNKKYNSLYYTTKKWLQKEKNVAAPGANFNPGNTANGNNAGRIVKIANAFEEALQYGS